jgi:hypothetical protein
MLSLHQRFPPDPNVNDEYVENHHHMEEERKKSGTSNPTMDDGRLST